MWNCNVFLLYASGETQSRKHKTRSLLNSVLASSIQSSLSFGLLNEQKAELKYEIREKLLKDMRKFFFLH